jgi:hypothetical protein
MGSGMGIRGQGNVVVGVGATRVSATSVPCSETLLQSDSGDLVNANSTPVFVGVSTDPAVLMASGIVVRPGQAIPVSCVNMNSLYATCSAGGQYLRWTAL